MNKETGRVIDAGVDKEGRTYVTVRPDDQSLGAFIITDIDDASPTRKPSEVAQLIGTTISIRQVCVGSKPTRISGSMFGQIDEDAG